MGCLHCGGALHIPKRGRKPDFCSTRCRVAGHRANRGLPAEMTRRAAWTRADGRRPIQCDGSAASSTNPGTWTTFADVHRSTAGDGLGIMLGNGLGCYDFDHCLDGDTITDQAVEFVASITEPIVWTERSMSGTGLHVFVLAAEAPGTRRPGFERYTRARFIRVTGDRVTTNTLSRP